MTNKTERYALRETNKFPVYEGVNYVIDTPKEEGGSDIAIRLSWGRLNEGDLIRLPSGSWLEVTLDSDCFGYSGENFGRLEIEGEYIVLKEEHRLFPLRGKNTLLGKTEEQIDKEISERRNEGRVYKTLASYIA